MRSYSSSELGFAPGELDALNAKLSHEFGRLLAEAMMLDYERRQLLATLKSIRDARE